MPDFPISGRNPRNQLPHEAQTFHPIIRAFNALFYNWRDTSAKQNFIGAEAAAFTTLMLPLQKLKGPGEVVKKQLMTYAPQVYVTQSVVPTGIAGIQAGQSWQAGLLDNADLSGNEEIV